MLQCSAKSWKSLWSAHNRGGDELTVVSSEYLEVTQSEPEVWFLSRLFEAATLKDFFRKSGDACRLGGAVYQKRAFRGSL
jgi:hypothetical protein